MMHAENRVTGAYNLGRCVDSQDIYICRTANILHFRVAKSF